MRLFDKVWQRPTLPRITAVPLALQGLTSLFGMGRGGLLCYSHHKAVCIGVSFKTDPNIVDCYERIYQGSAPRESLRVISTAQL